MCRIAGVLPLQPFSRLTSYVLHLRCVVGRALHAARLAERSQAFAQHCSVMRIQDAQHRSLLPPSHLEWMKTRRALQPDASKASENKRVQAMLDPSIRGIFNTAKTVLACIGKSVLQMLEPSGCFKEHAIGSRH